MEADLREKEKSSKASQQDSRKDKAAHDNLVKEIEQKQSSLDKLQYREGQLEDMMEKKQVDA